ncbi:MAG: TlpA disulfide reductase family protein [Xanthomonadales bacterium]|nr:TlpA disulfide reductase family protein [Xanthomonadales bacterium]
MRTFFPAFLWVLGFCAVAADFEPVPAPAWTAEASDGTTVEFPGEADRPRILLFWATWCPYCKKLMPHLQSIVDEYGDAISVISVSVFEEDDGDPAGDLEDFGYQFGLIKQGESIAEQYGVKGTPGLFLVDEQGMIRWHLGLAMQDEARMAGLSKHWERASRRAPFWAAELRKALDIVLAH